MSKELLQELVFIANGQVGTREEGGNNKGTDIIVYQRATWLAPAAWSWCAAFICWLLKKWLEDPRVAPALKITNGEVWRCKDASAFGWEKWAKAKGLTVLPETALAKLGDIVIFDFSHIGIVIKDQLKGELIQTIEGNTNGKGERDSKSGDGVWIKTREPSLVRSYIRLIV